MADVALVLDSDIGTDVDDALALAFALRHPGIHLRAVTTVSGDALRRAHIAAKLVSIAGRDDVEVATGLGGTGPEGRSAWMGHEGEGLLEPGEEPAVSRRDAVEVLLRSCRTPGACEIATIGMQTNVAAALDRDPGLARRVGRVAVMGGMFSEVRSGAEVLEPSADHNLNVDAAAALRALNAGMPLLYVPLDVTMRTYLTRAQLERLRAGNALCRALARLVDVWAPILHRRAGGRLPADHVAVMHDPLTVAAVVDRRFLTTESMPVTVALHEGSVRTFIDPVAGNPAEVVTSVDADAFAALWLATVLG